MKNAFYLILKPLSVLKINFRSQDRFTFFKIDFLNFWSCGKNDMIRRIRLTSNFMTSQPGYQTITIQILPNNSRSKDNQIMKFVQLIGYYKRMFFLRNSCSK